MDIPQLAAILARYEAAELDRTIHPADRMWNIWTRNGTGLSELSGLQCVLAGLGMTWQTREPETIIDFGCGYGRVARHLRAAFPASNFHWCDFDGATFCAERFGGDAIVSDIDPEAVKLPQQTSSGSGPCLPI